MSSKPLHTRNYICHNTQDSSYLKVGETYKVDKYSNGAMIWINSDSRRWISQRRLKNNFEMMDLEVNDE